jgi:hypothetical protein
MQRFPALLETDRGRFRSAGDIAVIVFQGSPSLHRRILNIFIVKDRIVRDQDPLEKVALCNTCRQPRSGSISRLHLSTNRDLISRATSRHPLHYSLLGRNLAPEHQHISFLCLAEAPEARASSRRTSQGCSPTKPAPRPRILILGNQLTQRRPKGRPSYKDSIFTLQAGKPNRLHH